MLVVDETPDAMVAVRRTAEVVVDEVRDTRPNLIIRRRLDCARSYSTISSITVLQMRPI
jgi:hypothetical protein